MVQTRSNANVGTGVPQQGKNSATGGRHPPITTGEAEALIQRVGITTEQFKEVLAALAPNCEVVVGDVAGGPTGEKAGPAGSQGKKKKVRRSQKKKATKPNGKAMMADALSRLEEEDESSSFERMSAFDRLGDLKSKKPRTSAFERLQDTRSARKGDLRDTLKEKRGESSATSKVGSEERRRTVEDKGAAELWKMYEQLEKQLDAQNPYRQVVFSEVTPFSRRIMSCPLPDNFKTPQIKAYNGTTDPQDHLARFGANVVMYAYPEEIKCRCFLATLEGQACEWFHKLPKGSIDKWGDLAHKFLEHFASSRRQKLPFSHLLNVKIRKGEQLREFINRWEKEARDVQGADDQALIAMLQAALPQGDVRKELRRNPLSTYQEMLARAKYLALEEEDDEPPVRKEKKSGPPVAEGKKRKEYGKGPNPTGYHANRHPVHAVQSLPAPPHGRESYGVQDAPKYCEYHRNSTHNTEEPDWIDEITMYILDGSLPIDPIAAKVVRRRAPSYTLECGRLYKRSYNGTLLRCLRAGEAQKLMEEIHEGICSAHQGAFTMSRKVTLQGYFWPTIIRDCAEYVRKCKVCQEFQRMPGRPATNYTPISTAIPFARWGIDLVGILPRGTGNNTYLVVAIDYFTKWVEAAPVPTITAEQMTKFVSKQILCRFGVPQQIITDNGTQFEAGGFNEFLQSWGIKHSYAAVGYPQTNGQVENTNRTIMDGLKKKIMECKSTWVEEVPYILWTYRTTPRKATGETPFSLTYGFEARAPAETSLLSHRVETFDAQGNEENLRAELHLIDERREKAYMRAENYRRQVKSYHDQRVRPRQFKMGDWVLRKWEVSRPIDGGKFAKSFEGPYIIKEVLADGTFRLQTPTGGDVPRATKVEDDAVARKSERTAKSGTQDLLIA
ncbi:unnamed protein product [Cuscuta campestris]|uniref:Integrase catalytic domain-containing protein n=1 Tax=Cuscuta campestris TaxID=132261 RepID=A0A484NDN1_9ASTE|nr:unnamed protein product [Cuscuta campestris]